ncbi:MAG: transcription activator effector binding [Chloroflexi bacterium]|jgi:effector-binding domain-containing protein|nr:transcription activator effector binding [Chloroflexota bacterium]
MEREVKVGPRDAITVVSKRVPVRLSEIGPVMGAAFGEVYGFLGARGIAPFGPPFVIYHGMPSGDDPFDIEICAPVGGAAGAPSGWQVQVLPAGTFATLLHVGPYDTIGVAYATLTEWIGAQGMSFAGPPREVYLSPPETPPDQIRTIIEFPVSEAAARA